MQTVVQTVMQTMVLTVVQTVMQTMVQTVMQTVMQTVVQTVMQCMDIAKVKALKRSRHESVKAPADDTWNYSSDDEPRSSEPCSSERVKTQVTCEMFICYLEPLPILSTDWSLIRTSEIYNLSATERRTAGDNSWSKCLCSERARIDTTQACLL